MINKFKKRLNTINLAILRSIQTDDIVHYQLVKSSLLYNILHSKEPGISEYEPGARNIIVSLTTHKKRIFDVPYVIESLLEQTLKPNKIILWLTEGEYNNIPLMLKHQQERGADIRYCANFRSYKKLIPTLKEYPDDIIITVDDDIIYPNDMVENLYRAYQETPNAVCCYRLHKMTFDRKGNLNPYDKWEICYNGEELSNITLPTGIGSVLYPPHCFHQDVLRDDLFTKLAPTADDVWFKAMTLLHGTQCRRVPFENKILPIPDHQDIALFFENGLDQKNDIQIKQTFNYYNLWDQLKK
jgi:hypothetical protein